MPTFQKSLETCLPDLWRYAYSLSFDKALADDLVQDCAERALRKQQLWDRSRPLKPWLMTILLNIHRNTRRRGNFLRLVPVEDAPPTAAPGSTETRMDLADTARAIEMLPPEQREALLLVVIGGLSYKQAAEALDIPTGTLMSRIGRARRNLRQMTAADPVSSFDGNSR